MYRFNPIYLLIFTFGLIGSCFGQSVEQWVTTQDQTQLLEKQKKALHFKASKIVGETITIDERSRFQLIEGFGFALTGGSADVINQLPSAERRKLLNELFGKGESSIGISYLRISIGASDLNSFPFTYNDLPPGQKDLRLKNFSFGEDEKSLIPLLKEIIRINPKIRLMGSPWTAPVWMKDKDSFIGGSLRREFYGVYAQYFVRYIREMAKRGIRINAVTPQNEPLHGGNNPSMVMEAKEQADFIKNHLGPAFKKAKISTKIIIYDHNCDRPDYPIEILNDPATKKFIAGSAFHLYGGDISAMGKVRDAHPDKGVYFTEQYTSSKGDFGGDLNWHIKNVLIGSLRNWSKTVLEWNLASDAEFKPHTIGGCDVCKGGLTIAGTQVTRNVSYYVVAHAAKFVPPGSVRIASEAAGKIINVAFKTPRGEKVLIVLNEGRENGSLQMKYRNRYATVKIEAGAVGTYVWK